MPNEAVLHEIEIGELILAVDDSRDATKAFKLNALLRAGCGPLGHVEGGGRGGHDGRGRAGRFLPKRA